VLEFEATDLDVYVIDGVSVPRIRLTIGETAPSVELRVGEQLYRWDRSYPIKGHSAVLPPYLQRQMLEGKSPLLIERPDRFYIYLAV
jgi:hypothetical protein